MDKSLLDFLRRLCRLADIERCSNTAHINSYPVSTHSFYVAIFAMVFADIENQRIAGDELIEMVLTSDPRTSSEEERRALFYDTSEVIKRALLHDIEESETGDILYPLHNMNEAFGQKLDEIRDNCIDEVVFDELPFHVRRYYINLWKTSKDDTKEGRLVAAMDKFEILMFSLKELDMGNESFRPMYESTKEIIKSGYKIPSLQDLIGKIENLYG